MSRQPVSLSQQSRVNLYFFDGEFSVGNITASHHVPSCRFDLLLTLCAQSLTQCVFHRGISTRNFKVTQSLLTCERATSSTQSTPPGSFLKSTFIGELAAAGCEIASSQLPKVWHALP